MGALSDRFGHKPLLVLGMLGPGLISLLLASAPGIGWLLVGYVVSGIIGAVYTTVNAYVADISAPEGRTARFGLLGAAFGVGFIVGPLAGGLATASSESSLSMVGAGCPPQWAVPRPRGAAIILTVATDTGRREPACGCAPPLPNRNAPAVVP